MKRSSISRLLRVKPLRRSRGRPRIRALFFADGQLLKYPLTMIDALLDGACVRAWNLG